MRTRRRATIEDLRLAIDCLPRRTRVAMLAGMQANEIIVGAYTNHDGICPMLAAHRAGGRTNVIAFAKAWDRFAFRDARSTRARRATERELLVLRSHLEASLLDEDGPAADLASARADHVELLAARERRPEPAPADPGPRRADRPPPTEDLKRRGRPGDPDRSRALGQRPGWAWTRVVRRYDEYERVLAHVRSECSAAEMAAQKPAGEREPSPAR